MEQNVRDGNYERKSQKISASVPTFIWNSAKTKRKQLKQRGGNNQISNKRTISGRTDLRIKARPKFAGWNQQQSKD